MHGKAHSHSPIFEMSWSPANATLTDLLTMLFLIFVFQFSTLSAQGQTPTAGGGWTEQVLHNFGNGADGAAPWAGLIIDAAGNLYGTTHDGGTYGDGTVFEISPEGGANWTEKVLYSFNFNDRGCGGPYGGLVMDHRGNLYGTTSAGGGCVFELTPNGDGTWTEKALFGFDAPGGGPFAGLIFDAAGNLYGTTIGGGAYRNGSAFELTPNGNGTWTETELHSFQFDGTDGIAPYAPLIFDSVGNLYGTTTMGGNDNVGTVFELMPSGGGTWTEKVLHTFSGSDGCFPYAGLIIDAAENLYGTTWCGPRFGTVFELTPTGGGDWVHKVLHNFGNPAVDGAGPYAPLIFDSAGKLYGTTFAGPVLNGVHVGTVFELKPTGGHWLEQVLYSFSQGTDGSGPYGGLVMDAHGNLYGTTVQNSDDYQSHRIVTGASGSRGIVFELSHD